MEITSLDRIREMSRGEAVELSPYFEGEPFIVRLKRPSLYMLAARGVIPNPLLGAAKEVFDGKGGNEDKEDNVDNDLDGHKFKDMAELLNIVAENALVEPTYQQFEESGISLTDMQLIQIFNYTQTGVKMLERFRNVEAADTSAESKSEV